MLRRLRPEQWEAARAIRLEALREHPGAFFSSLAEAQKRTDADWQAMLVDPDLAIFGLFDGERLAGLTAAYIDRDDPTDTTAGLAMSYIRAAWRGRGLTRLFYAIRLDWARERGATRVVVTHRASNEPSRRAILAAGFSEIGRSAHLWPDGMHEDDVRYELRLAD